MTTPEHPVTLSVSPPDLGEHAWRVEPKSNGDTLPGFEFELRIIPPEPLKRVTDPFQREACIRNAILSVQTELLNILNTFGPFRLRVTAPGTHHLAVHPDCREPHWFTELRTPVNERGQSFSEAEAYVPASEADRQSSIQNCPDLSPFLEGAAAAVGTAKENAAQQKLLQKYLSFRYALHETLRAISLKVSSQQFRP